MMVRGTLRPSQHHNVRYLVIFQWADHGKARKFLPIFGPFTEIWCCVVLRVRQNHARIYDNRIKVTTGMMRVVLCEYSAKPGYNVAIFSNSSVRSGS